MVATFSKARAAVDASPAVAAACPRTPLDEVILVRCPVADGLGFAHLGDRFLALLRFDQLDRGLDGRADLGSHRLGARARLLRERGRGEQGDRAKSDEAKAHEAKADAHVNSQLGAFSA